MNRVTELHMEQVDYYTYEGLCSGTNLMYKVDGTQRSSRVPWVATSPSNERDRLENLLKETKQ